MSAERPLPPATAARLACTAVAVMALGWSAACRRGPEAYLLESRAAPSNQQVAAVTLARCDGGWCETLGIGATVDAARPVATLPSLDRCTEIVWSRDASRVGFLINGYQLRLYNVATRAPAGLIDLVPHDTDPSTRIARGVTFSDNGAALTFDDCPRDRSGCRPGLVALR